MKASTLFVIAIALLIGLGAAAGARYFGLFEKKQEQVQTKEEAIMVLVANKDLYKNVAITSADVRVRELRPDEKAFYDQNRGNLMPAITSAAQFKIPVDKIRADQPLRRKDFQEELPEPVSLRLEKDMRAVTVMVPKERCAGGVIQLGEYVDVLLTSKLVEDARTGRTSVKTVVLDRMDRVIMKRGNLRTHSEVDTGPISFTLQVNPYRASLIEYAQHRGIISLVPVQVPSEQVRISDPTPRDSGMPRSFRDMASKEYRDEDERVAAITKGDYVVSDLDLERVFAIQPPPSPIPPIRVNNIVGIYSKYEHSFPQGGGSPAERNTGGATGKSGVYSFDTPTADKDCPTCNKDKKGPPEPFAMPK